MSTTVFDRQLKRRQRAFCLNQLKDSTYYDYLRDESARQLTDRLEDITRTFPLALELGAFRGTLYDYIQDRPSLQGKGGVGGIEHLVQCDLTVPSSSSAAGQGGELVRRSWVQADEEFLPFKPESFDLVLSSLSMHWVNDLPSALRQAHDALKADGAFVASFLGGDTLRELRNCFYLAELERKGGLSPHCSPLLRASDVASLVQAAGFAIPTVDVETVTISYPDAFTLMEHLYNMGEGQAALNRQYSVGRDTFLAAAALYQHMHAEDDGSVLATFEVLSRAPNCSALADDDDVIACR